MFALVIPPASGSEQYSLEQLALVFELVIPPASGSEQYSLEQLALVFELVTLIPLASGFGLEQLALMFVGLSLSGRVVSNVETEQMVLVFAELLLLEQVV